MLVLSALARGVRRLHNTWDLRLDTRDFPMSQYAMPEDQRKEGEEPEEDEYERRFREIEERARQIAAKSRAPEPPSVAALSKNAGQKQTEGRKADTKSPQLAPANMNSGLGIAFAIGYSFVGPILAGIIIGSLLDGRPGGTWTLVGVFLGTVAALVLLVRLVARLNQNEQK